MTSNKIPISLRIDQTSYNQILNLAKSIGNRHLEYGMLSLKDRWRQATKEADHIERKHVFTLQRGISVPQTDEMKHQNVQLVLPKLLHASQRKEQRNWLWDLSTFVAAVKDREHTR